MAACRSNTVYNFIVGGLRKLQHRWHGDSTQLFPLFALMDALLMMRGMEGHDFDVTGLDLVPVLVDRVDLAKQQGVVNDASLGKELGVLFDDTAEGARLLQQLLQILVLLIEHDRVLVKADEVDVFHSCFSIASLSFFERLVGSEQVASLNGALQIEEFRDREVLKDIVHDDEV